MPLRPSAIITPIAPASPTAWSTPVHDLLPFLRSWLIDPVRVGAIAPSGSALAALITRDIAPGTGPVIELGPGTGVFTRALLARGVRERDLTLVESGPDFAKMLQSRFPEARVLCMNASRLHEEGLFEENPAAAVVSGLPLRNMPRHRVLAILIAAFGCMRPDGVFHQFTYGPRFPLPQPFLDRLGFKVTRLGGTLANLPPAAVYRVSRRKPARLAPPRWGTVE